MRASNLSCLAQKILLDDSDVVKVTQPKQCNYNISSTDLSINATLKRGLWYHKLLIYSIIVTSFRRTFITTPARCVIHYCIHPPLVGPVIEERHVAISGFSIAANLDMTRHSPVIPTIYNGRCFGTPNMVGTPPKHLRQMGISGPIPIRLIFDKAAKDFVGTLHSCPTSCTIVRGQILTKFPVVRIMVQSVTASLEKL